MDNMNLQVNEQQTGFRENQFNQKENEHELYFDYPDLRVFEQCRQSADWPEQILARP